MAIPVETLLIGNLQPEVELWQERAGTAMGAGPLFLGDLRKQPGTDSQNMKDWIARYNRLRSSVGLTDSFFPSEAGSNLALTSGMDSFGSRVTARA